MLVTRRLYEVSGKDDKHDLIDEVARSLMGQ